MEHTRLQELLGHRLCQKAGNTAQAYRRIILRYAKFLETYPDKTHAPHVKIQAFLIARYMRLSASSKNQAVAALAWYYRTVHQQKIDVTRIRAKTGLHLPSLLSWQDIQAGIAILPMPHRLLAVLFAGAGLTLEEALSLQSDHIHQETVFLRERDVPLPTSAQTLILAQKKKSGQRQSSLLFPSRRSPMTRMASNAFSHACRAAGLPKGFTPTALRTAYILWMLREAGLPLAQARTGLSAAQLKRYQRAILDHTVKSPLDSHPL